jgi:hypothetical protein
VRLHGIWRCALGFAATSCALLTPAGAQAHAGFTQVAVTEVCGRTCRSVLPPLELFHSDPRLKPRAVKTRPAPPGPYYTLHLLYSRPPPAFFVPSTGTLRSFPDPFGVGDPVWLRLEPRVEARLRARLRGLEPLPRPRLTQASVSGHRVADPQPYLSLYRHLPAVGGFGGGGTAIRLTGDELNPWADGYNALSYHDGLLRRDGETVRLPRDLVNLVEEPRLAPSRRLPVAPLVLLGACLAAATGFAVLRHRLMAHR